MKSSTPKVLHEVCGRPMLGHALAAARELAPRQLAVVVGEADGPVARYLADYWPDARVIVQGPRRGTGHAVRVAVEALAAVDGPGLDGTDCRYPGLTCLYAAGGIRERDLGSRTGRDIDG